MHGLIIFERLSYIIKYMQKFELFLIRDGVGSLIVKLMEGILNQMHKL